MRFRLEYYFRGERDAPSRRPFIEQVVIQNPRTKERFPYTFQALCDTGSLTTFIPGRVRDFWKLPISGKTSVESLLRNNPAGPTRCPKSKVHILVKVGTTEYCLARNHKAAFLPPKTINCKPELGEFIIIGTDLLNQWKVCYDGTNKKMLFQNSPSVSFAAKIINATLGWLGRGARPGKDR